MTNKELILLGMSLEALLEAGEIEKVKKIVSVMASNGVKPEVNNKKGKKKSDG
ncbi:MAG: hypothetical protein LBC86_09845 [Oscillospiraceae bacterium]|jgi:pentatricopeptide repeat protein|nr:hypothetical protein [Oscillospiraceae bacterium]